MSLYIKETFSLLPIENMAIGEHFNSDVGASQTYCEHSVRLM